MDFREAAGFVMTFGMHKHHTIDQIAETDVGLRYLDWLSGQPWVKGELKEALETYLRNPSIEKEVGEVIEQNGIRDTDYR